MKRLYNFCKATSGIALPVQNLDQVGGYLLLMCAFLTTYKVLWETLSIYVRL